MTRREFMRLAVAASATTCVSLDDPDPVLPVVLAGWYSNTSDYERFDTLNMYPADAHPATYYWLWRDRGITYRSYGSESLEPTDNPFLWRARRSTLMAMLDRNRVQT